MSGQEKKSPIKPFKTFRHGAVAASVWRRQAPSGFEYFDFSVSRSWKATTTGKEGYSPNFFVSNTPALVMRQQAGLPASKKACKQACMSQCMTTTFLCQEANEIILALVSEARVDSI